MAQAVTIGKQYHAFNGLVVPVAVQPGIHLRGVGIHAGRKVSRYGYVPPEPLVPAKHAKGRRIRTDEVVYQLTADFAGDKILRGSIGYRNLYG
jgi:hypothetical protein